MKYKVQEQGINRIWNDATIEVNSKIWSNCIFDTKREAEVYAHLWCKYDTKENANIVAEEFSITKPKTILNHLGTDTIMRIIPVEHNF